MSDSRSDRYPSGISQKTVIALILVWLSWVSFALLREMRR